MIVKTSVLLLVVASLQSAHAENSKAGSPAANTNAANPDPSMAPNPAAPAGSPTAQSPAPKKPLAKGWALKLKGDATEPFDVSADGKPLELTIGAKTIQTAKKTFEWSSRYGSRTPTQVREEFVKITDALEEVKAEVQEAAKEREAVEKEIAFAKKEGADAKELKGLDGDLKKAQREEAKITARHDQMVKKLMSLTGDKGTLYLIPGKKIEEAVESFPGAKLDMAKSTLKFKSPRGEHRYLIQYCQDEKGCEANGKTVPKGTVTQVAPECGPDLWKSTVNFTKLADSKQTKVPTEERLYSGVPCR